MDGRELNAGEIEQFGADTCTNDVWFDVDISKLKEQRPTPREGRKKRRGKRWCLLASVRPPRNYSPPLLGKVAWAKFGVEINRLMGWAGLGIAECQQATR